MVINILAVAAANDIARIHVDGGRARDNGVVKIDDDNVHRAVTVVAVRDAHME